MIPSLLGRCVLLVSFAHALPLNPPRIWPSHPSLVPAFCFHSIHSPFLVHLFFFVSVPGNYFFLSIRHSFSNFARLKPESLLQFQNSHDAKMAAAITGSVVLVAFLCIIGYLLNEWRLRRRANPERYRRNRATGSSSGKRSNVSRLHCLSISLQPLICLVSCFFFFDSQEDQTPFTMSPIEQPAYTFANQRTLPAAERQRSALPPDGHDPSFLQPPNFRPPIIYPSGSEGANLS